MLVEKLNILKKPYLPPRIEFEELEEDEMEMLMLSRDDAEVPNPPSGPSNPDLPSPTSGLSAYDFDFSVDFVVNDEPQL